MGLFDEVFCRRVLPDGFDGAAYGKPFQTKNFDCTLDVLTITEDGRLTHDEWHFEEVPLEERPNPKFPFMGSLRRVVNRADVDLNFHGTFTFYTSAEGVWHEYKAKFTDGQLVSIEVVKLVDKTLDTH